MWLYLATLPPFRYSATLYFLKMFSQASMRDDKAVSGFSCCRTDNLDILTVCIQCIHGFLLHIQQAGGSLHTKRIDCRI